MPYFTILCVLMCMGFFAKAAEVEGRPGWVGGALSLGAWIAFTSWGVGGNVGGFLSQAILFAGWTVYSTWRDKRSNV